MMLVEKFSKIPAVCGSSDEILLVNKEDVFIPDDLLLMDAFKKSSESALFVWLPRRNWLSLPWDDLIKLYCKIGVRKVSESVSASALKCAELKQVNLKDVFIVKGLVMLVLGFLADPKLKLEVKRRHETVKPLLNVSVFETLKPLTTSYSLTLTSGDIIKAEMSQLVRWERESLQFFAQKLDRSCGFKYTLEYATKFSEVLSKGLLWQKEEFVPRLSELIKVGFLMNFDEDAIAYLMMSKNMQIFEEDEEFISSVFPSS